MTDQNTIFLQRVENHFFRVRLKGLECYIQQYLFHIGREFSGEFYDRSFEVFKMDRRRNDHCLLHNDRRSELIFSADVRIELFQQVVPLLCGLADIIVITDITGYTGNYDQGNKAYDSDNNVVFYDTTDQ